MIPPRAQIAFTRLAPSFLPDLYPNARSAPLCASWAGPEPPHSPILLFLILFALLSVDLTPAPYPSSHFRIANLPLLAVDDFRSSLSLEVNSWSDQQFPPYFNELSSRSFEFPDREPVA